MEICSTLGGLLGSEDFAFDATNTLSLDLIVVMMMMVVVVVVIVVIN